MSSLLQIQNYFQQFLLTGESLIDLFIKPDDVVSVKTRLGVYADAYESRLIEALMTQYPALYQYLGSEEFHKLAQAYVTAHPSIYRSIRWYGQDLAQLLVRNYPNQYPYLAELAEFEWSLSLGFDAEDAQRVKVEDMTQLLPQDWAGLQFKVHPTLHRMNFFWNVPHVWQALTNDQSLPTWENGNHPQAWVLWRGTDNITQYYSLSDEEGWALDAVIQGISFGELCEGLCQWFELDQVSLRAASYLKGWIEKGLLAGLVL
jgi:hypothetical protein